MAHSDKCILILGGSGQVGSVLASEFRKLGFQVKTTGRTRNANFFLDASSGQHRFATALSQILQSCEYSAVISALADGVSHGDRARMTLANSEIDRWILQCVGGSLPVIFLKSELSAASGPQDKYAFWHQDILEENKCTVLLLPKVSIRSYREGIFESDVLTRIEMNADNIVLNDVFRNWTSCLQVFRTVHHQILELQNGMEGSGKKYLYPSEIVMIKNSSVASYFRILLDTWKEQSRLTERFSLFEFLDLSVDEGICESNFHLVSEIAYDLELFVRSYMSHIHHTL